MMMMQVVTVQLHRAYSIVIAYQSEMKVLMNEKDHSIACSK